MQRDLLDEADGQAAAPDTERTVRLPGASQLRSGLLGGPVPGLRVQALGDHLYLNFTFSL